MGELGLWLHNMIRYVIGDDLEIGVVLAKSGETVAQPARMVSSMRGFQWKLFINSSASLVLCVAEHEEVVGRHCEMNFLGWHILSLSYNGSRP